MRVLRALCRFLASDEDGGRTFLVLDHEGPGGGNALPHNLQTTLQYASERDRDRWVPCMATVVADAAMPRYCALRRRSVREHLPRFAYASSDVIVFETTLDMANHDVTEMLEDIGRSCTEGLRTQHRPFLVVVMNKQTTMQAQAWLANQEQQLAEWMALHSGHIHLSPFFSGVQIVQMPSVVDAVSASVADAVQGVFVRTVEQMLEQRVQMRAAAGIAMSYNVWVHVLSSVLDKFHDARALQVDEIL